MEAFIRGRRLFQIFEIKVYKNKFLVIGYLNTYTFITHLSILTDSVGKNNFLIILGCSLSWILSDELG